MAINDSSASEVGGIVLSADADANVIIETETAPPVSFFHFLSLCGGVAVGGLLHMLFHACKKKKTFARSRTVQPVHPGSRDKTAWGQVSVS